LFLNSLPFGLLQRRGLLNRLNHLGSFMKTVSACAYRHKKTNTTEDYILDCNKRFIFCVRKSKHDNDEMSIWEGKENRGITSCGFIFRHRDCCPTHLVNTSALRCCVISRYGPREKRYIWIREQFPQIIINLRE
jgi:hypothetical protein